MDILGGRSPADGTLMMLQLCKSSHRLCQARSIAYLG